MSKLSNGCHAVNSGRLVPQTQFPSLSRELEILAPDISGHTSFIVVAYLPVYGGGKCKKVAYVTSGNLNVNVEFYDSTRSTQPYRTQTYTPYTLPPRHMQQGKEILEAYQVLLQQYMNR